VEAYKTGLVASPELADLIDREAKALMGRDLPLLSKVVALSAQTKADVVSQDFREAGLRRILNFGHTLGHAVEGFHRFRISHGQAVAVGLAVATCISRARGMISEDLEKRILKTVRLIAPGRVEIPPVNEAWEIMRQDKKIRGRRLVFVLLEAPGKAVCVDDVLQKDLADAVTRLKERRVG
jgi:3-dehydroquinate synthetase